MQHPRCMGSLGSAPRARYQGAGAPFQSMCDDQRYVQGRRPQAANASDASRGAREQTAREWAERQGRPPCLLATTALKGRFDKSPRICEEQKTETDAQIARSIWRPAGTTVQRGAARGCCHQTGHRPPSTGALPGRPERQPSAAPHVPWRLSRPPKLADGRSAGPPAAP